MSPVRAMVLAAGLGTRLRPLTERVPKPLLPVANRPLLEYTFARLAAAGVVEAIVNVHHLPDVMLAGLRDLDVSGIAVRTSVEPEILGTAGGVRRAEPFLRSGAFLLLNGDFLVDADLERVIDFHRRQQAAATMVLTPDPDGGVIGVDPDGTIRRFIAPPAPGEPPSRLSCGFTGIHVLEPRVLDLVPPGRPWEINRQLYPELLARGERVCGFVHRGYWREAGSPGGLLAANLEVLGGRAGGLVPRPGAGSPELPGARCEGPVLAGEGARAGDGAVVGPEAVIGPGTRIGAGALVRRAVVLAGTVVPEGAVVERAVVGPAGRVDA